MKKICLIWLVLLFTSVLGACEGLSFHWGSRDSSTDGVLRTPYTDALELDLDPEGRSFLEDAIGEVALYRCIDGDTARFTEDGGKTHYSVRFLGIDTPETGRNPEPWAYAASAYVCDALHNADTIVLEWDFSTFARKGTYGRWLAFVWVDGRLLNLELIELAFTHATGFSPKYGEIMHQAWYATMKTHRRIHGERDPDFDYGD